MSLRRVIWRCRPSQHLHIPPTRVPLPARKANRSTHKDPKSQKPRAKSPSDALSPDETAIVVFFFVVAVDELLYEEPLEVE